MSVSSKYNSYSIDDGKIGADMTCQDKQGSLNIKYEDGREYGTDTDTMQMTAAADTGGQEMSMEMEMEIASKRVRECDGEEAL